MTPSPDRHPLLFLNNTVRPSAVPAVVARAAAEGFEIHEHWAANGDFPDPSVDFAGVVISGSPRSAYDEEDWIRREGALLRDFAARGVPQFGICFGSQILASALVDEATVYRRSACEVGFLWLEVTEAAASDPVCCELGPRIRMFVWHNDDIGGEHPAMQVMARSEGCGNQIWRHRDHLAWGVQGHLEITAPEAEAWFGRNRDRLEADGAEVDRLIAEFEEAEAARTMLRRFLGLCRAEAAGRPEGPAGAVQRDCREI